MKKTFVLFVTLTLITLSVYAFEPIRISVTTTPNVSPATAHLNVDVLTPAGVLLSSIITDADMSTEPTGVISVILNNSAWNSYVYSANDLLRVSYNSIVLSVERMEVAIAKQSLQGAHYVGELYGGGVVFYVDHTGNHGLICSMVDVGSSVAWSDVTGTTVPAPGALSDWDGLTNSTAIVAQSTATIAADLCFNYTNDAGYIGGAKDDWYLPSRGELNHLWNNLYQVQKALESDGNSFTTILRKSYYWASTEADANRGYAINFLDGSQITIVKTTTTNYYVRAVRAF